MIQNELMVCGVRRVQRGFRETLEKLGKWTAHNRWNKTWKYMGQSTLDEKNLKDGASYVKD